MERHEPHGQQDYKNAAGANRPLLRLSATHHDSYRFRLVVTSNGELLPVAEDQHFTPKQIAERWGISVNIVRRLFADVPGVLKYGSKGRYVSLRIPARIMQAMHAEYSS